MKNTKKSLFFSITALILCCALLAGTTLAWFTDSVTSGVNTIKAGNLDIEVTHTGAHQSGTVEGSTALFTDINGNPMKWEPGAVAYETFTIKNVGTLALKYKLDMNIVDFNNVKDAEGNATNNNLKKVLKVKFLPQDQMISNIDRQKVQQIANWDTVTDTLDVFQVNGNALYPSSVANQKHEEQFQVVVYWQPGPNDNDWNVNNGKTTTDGQPLFINFGINVVATQLEHENDSFGNTYDQNAVYPALVSRVDSTTSQPVSVDADSKLMSETSFTDNNAVSNVPASTAMYSAYTDDSNNTPVDPSTTGTLNRVIKTTDTTADSVTYDISYNYVLDGNSTPVVKFGNVVENVIEVSKGLNVVKVTHSHNGVETPMTKAENTIDKRDSTYYYDSDAGKIYVWSSAYSSFKVDYTSNFVAAVNGQGYATLEDAIKAAENDATVMLLKNIEASSVIQINKNLTLDLNGFVVTNNVADGRLFHVGDAVSFVINGTKVGSTMVIPDTNTESLGFIKISAAATVTLNGGSYIGNTKGGALIRVFAPSDDDPAPDAIITLNNVTATTNTRVFHMDTGNKLVLNVIGGTYTATADVTNKDSMYSVFGVDCYDLYTPLTFTGVTVNTAGGACVESSGCTATYTDCNFTVNEASNPAFTATAVAVSWEGTANIKSGTYTSAGYGIYVYSSGGTINVENGTISGETAAACASVSNGADATINISGGEIIGSLKTAGTGATASISVSGGKFSEDPSAYLATDCEASRKDDARYHVEKIEYWKDHAAASYATSVDTTNKLVTIASAEELALFANEVSGTTNYSGYTVNITANIDLGGKRWTPINAQNRMTGIIINGNRHTIDNMIIRTNCKNNYGTGFIGDTSGAITFNDITFKGADVSFSASQAYSGNVGGIVMGYTYGTTVFNNVSVVDSTIYGYGKIGAILGMGADPGVKVAFNNCVSRNNTIMAVYNMGGLAGNIQRSSAGVDNAVVNNCTVENITVRLSSSDSYVDLVNAEASFKTDDRTGDTVSRELTGNYWVYGDYYYGGYADYYVSYGSSSYDPPITSGDHAGKYIANSEICINISNDNP